MVFINKLVLKYYDSFYFFNFNLPLNLLNENVSLIFLILKRKYINCYLFIYVLIIFFISFFYFKVGYISLLVSKS